MKFSDEVCQKIGNYIYRLVDPRNNETFYVGKGSGNRLFQHASLKNLKRDEWETDASLKSKIISDIHDAGLEVLHIIHRHGIPDESIFEVEAAVIDAFPSLSNVQGGHGSNSRGPMTANEVNDLYALPEINWEPDEILVLINVNNIEDRHSVESIYRQVQAAWRISRKRAQQADYVLAVVRGVVIGAFTAEKWLDATSENFPNKALADESGIKRIGFVGAPAPDYIWEKFVGARGKRIAIDGMRHVQNPIRYWVKK
jgi:uncharacterized protein